MPKTDFSSGILVQLILASFERQGILKDSHAEKNRLKITNSPQVDLSSKRQLLERAYLEYGASPIVQAGYDIRSMPDNPLSFAMLRAATIPKIIERLAKLERYFHSKHRTQLVEISEFSMQMKHISITSEKPEVFEHLLIGGLLAGILSQYGCNDIELRFQEKTAIVRGKVIQGFDSSGDCGHFTVSWSRLSRPEKPRGLEEVQRISEFTATGLGRYSAKVGALIAQDPVQKWSLAEMAQRLGVSTRTFQRRLTEEGTKFSECVLSARCQCAAYYMTLDTENITAIGFLSGFSDAAHFSKEFKKNMGLLPTNFLESLSSRQA